MLEFLLLAAQASLASAAPVQCEIRESRDEVGLSLVGSCEKSAVMLGTASTYEAYPNPRTGVVVAVVQRAEDTQVLLVRPDADGNALLDIITPDLARQAGRAPGAGLSDLSIDMTGFAETGVIAVQEAGTAKRGAPPSPAFSVDQLLADVALEQTLPKEAPNIVAVGTEQEGEQ